LHNKPSNYKLYAKPFTLSSATTYPKETVMNLLVASNKDPASINIKEQILKTYPFQKITQTYRQNPLYTTNIAGKNITLATLNEESINAQYLPTDFPDAELIVFISRHSSQSGTPTLTVHVPGNFGAAEFGGLPKTVSVAPAVAMQMALKALAQMKQKLCLTYEVSYEVTHHGPSLSVPALFVELGSSALQWGDQTAAGAVAYAAMQAITNSPASIGCPVALGIGGTHYNQKFTQLALEDKAVFGHMVPKYAVEHFDRELLAQCIQKTQGNVSVVLLDWKGIKSQEKPAILSALESTQLRIEKI
jgi:D-aminoacyl-tRNA deacylase